MIYRAVFLILCCASATFAQSSATFLGKSIVNTFGSDGSYVPLLSTIHPSYATVVPSPGTLTWTWQNGTTVWYQNSGSFSLTVNISGTAAHRITLYMLDYDPAQRAQTLTLQDPVSGAVLDTESVANFSQGVYYSWLVSGSVTIAVQLTGGLNPVISGVYFDPPTTAPTCSTRGQIVNLSWNSVSGASSYNVYKNGALLGSSSATSFSDSSVLAGTTIVYGISAVVNGVESQITSSTVMIPIS